MSAFRAVRMPFAECELDSELSDLLRRFAEQIVANSLIDK
jgi:hypothetical protein